MPIKIIKKVKITMIFIENSKIYREMSIYAEYRKIFKQLSNITKY